MKSKDLPVAHNPEDRRVALNCGKHLKIRDPNGYGADQTKLDKWNGPGPSHRLQPVCARCARVKGDDVPVFEAGKSNHVGWRLGIRLRRDQHAQDSV
jgi:hypothetical protein